MPNVVLGHRGMVGSAILRVFPNAKTGSLDLRERQPWLGSDDYVYLAAARVGGIGANSSRGAEFIHDNLAIELNVIEAARRMEVLKLLFLGSSCIYPRDCPQPIKEEYLMTGPLEPTNAPYAVAKIAGIVMCQAYRKQYGLDAISLMPTNLYGPGDKYDAENGHVIAAMIRKFRDAKERGDATVTLWGDGSAMREFMHVDDCAAACVWAMDNYSAPEPLNVGTGEEVSIKMLAEMVRDVAGYRGAIQWDTSKPNGTPRKLLDCSRINALGWRAKIGLADGLESTYRAFCAAEAVAA